MNSFKAAREKTDYTQEQVSDIMDTDRSTIAKWETGASLPRAELLPKIAALYRCTVDELLRGETETA